MAGRKWIVDSGAISITAGATQVILGVKAPATTGLIISAAQISFEGGGAATEKAIKVEYCTWTTDGTGTGLATPKNANRQDDGSPALTAQYNYTSTSASGSEGRPSVGENVLRPSFVDGNKGNDSFPGGLVIKAGEVFGIRVTCPAGLTATRCIAWIGGDE